MSNNINIVCLVNEENLDYIKTTLFSLISNNNTNFHYEIFCLTNIDKKDEKCNFEIFKKINNTKIHIRDLNEYAIKFGIQNRKDFKINCMFYLDQIIPTYIEQIIYFSHKIIVNKSLLDLAKIKLTENEYLSMLKFNYQFHTDFTIINLKIFRDKFINQKYISLLNQNKILDIDEVLEDFKDNIREISFNVMRPNLNIDKYYMKVLQKYNHTFFQEQLNKIIGINKPSMILFINEPWKNKYVLFYDIWKQYYKECKYLESLLQ